MRERVLSAMRRAIDEFNTSLPTDRHIDAESRAPLLGAGGKLDSLGLVNLVIAIETELADEFGQRLALADERAMSRRHSPFRTLDTLADYIVELLSSQPHA
jgi:acyl carrier protein